MKCTQCGKSQFIKTELPGEGGSTLSSDVDVYICENCGHYEMFSMKRVILHNNIVKCMDGLNDDIKELNLKIKKADEHIEKITTEIKDTEQQIRQMGMDITIRQQQQLQQRIEELQKLEALSKNEKNSISKKLKEVESHIEEVRGVEEIAQCKNIKDLVYRFAYEYDKYYRERIKRNDFMTQVFDGLDEEG